MEGTVSFINLRPMFVLIDSDFGLHCAPPNMKVIFSRKLLDINIASALVDIFRPVGGLVFGGVVIDIATADDYVALFVDIKWVGSYIWRSPVPESN